MKTGYYKADTIYGVQYVGELLEDATAEVLSAHDFLDNLDRLENGETIYTHMGIADSEVYDEIDADYGIAF